MRHDALYDRIHNSILGIIECYDGLSDAQVFSLAISMTEAAMGAIDAPTLLIMIGDE